MGRPPASGTHVQTGLNHSSAAVYTGYHILILYCRDDHRTDDTDEDDAEDDDDG